jgi:hypothetical protein
MPTYTVQCAVCKETRNIYRHVSEHGKWPKCCHRKMRQVILPAQIRKDIEPYQAVGFDVATGTRPVIGSRSRHQQYLRDNGYEEVGNEPIREQPKAADQLPGVRDEIVRNLKKVTGRPV